MGDLWYSEGMRKWSDRSNEGGTASGTDNGGIVVQSRRDGSWGKSKMDQWCGICVWDARHSIMAMSQHSGGR